MNWLEDHGFEVFPHKRKDLEKVFREASREANLRLRTIEKASKQSLSQAYISTIGDIHGLRGGRYRRFSTKLPPSYNQLEKEVKYILHFLDLQTSTLEGIEEYLYHHDEALTRTLGYEADDKTRDIFMRMWTNKYYERLEALVQSDTLIDIMNDLSDLGADLSQARLTEAFKRAIAYSKDRYVANYLRELLRPKRDKETDEEYANRVNRAWEDKDIYEDLPRIVAEDRETQRKNREAAFRKKFGR